MSRGLRAGRVENDRSIFLVETRGRSWDRTQHHSCRRSKAEPRKAEEENRAWEARGTRDPLNKDGSIVAFDSLYRTKVNSITNY